MRRDKANIRFHLLSTFYLFVITATITMKAFFRVIAAAFFHQSSAQALAGVLILPLVLYTGYTIPMPSMIGALKWITYINVSSPIMTECLADSLHVASSLRIRSLGFKRVSYVEWNVFLVGASRAWVWECVPGKSSLHYCWLCAWSTER